MKALIYLISIQIALDILLILIYNIFEKYNIELSDITNYTIKIFLTVFIGMYLIVTLQASLAEFDYREATKVTAVNNKSLSKESIVKLNRRIKVRNKVCKFLSPLEEIKVEQ